MERQWDAIMGDGALTPFSNMSIMLVKQKDELVMRWEAAEKQLEAWGVFCHTFLGDGAVHPTKYKVYSIL